VALENHASLGELARLREAAEQDRRTLLNKLGRQDMSEAIIGAERGLREVMDRVAQVAPTDAPVLILGETGSGKEVVARAMHDRSRRSSGPFLRVNCGAIPAELVDSELFGHEKGSFTGAIHQRRGWFERADGGTLFLDEVAELPPAAQVRLLRVLQDGSFQRVGGQETQAVDVRILAATHRDLPAMVRDGRFRQDLWYRISVFPIQLPALRQRPGDIPALAAHFAERAGLRLFGRPLLPRPAEVEALCAYDWPGNVRELAAVIERAAILGDGQHLEVGPALGLAVAGLRRSAPDEHNKAQIEEVLRQVHGRIEGPFGAAHALGVNPHTLRSRMRRLGISWEEFRRS
jgi:transcriptional regulator with GAF, ATPase, and Fis domain